MNSYIRIVATQWNIVCLRNISVDTPHTGDTKDNNNNNNTKAEHVGSSSNTCDIQATRIRLTTVPDMPRYQLSCRRNFMVFLSQSTYLLE